jgi:glyoxalase family protein
VTVADPALTGLHHVTATVTDAQADLDFYTKLLGLRLVKKTVNFDNHGVYHFYYGDERGSPSTLMTTFPYGGQGVPPGRKGAGQITATAFSVPAGALGPWRERLAEGGLEVEEAGERFGEAVLRFSDPSGLVIELSIGGPEEREPRPVEGLAEGAGIRGIHGVTLLIRDPEPSLRFLTDVLGFREVGTEGKGPGARHRVEVGAGGPGAFLDIVEAGDAPAAMNGLGTVHHVALGVPDAAGQLALREGLLRVGVHVTEVRDRQYFQSIYFREPGGVLYEIATLGPGFLVDEAPGELGRGLRLPPWEEPNRAAIESKLPAVSPG